MKVKLLMSNGGELPIKLYFGCLMIEMNNLVSVVMCEICNNIDAFIRLNYM